MVVDTSKCLKYSVEKLGCNGWNMVKDTSNCVKHVVQKVSCKGWNMVKDYSNCVKHVVEQGSCKGWNMVEDTTKCVGGFVHTAGKWMVDTVGHCSKWAGTCTKNQLEPTADMFKDCGANMLPFVPA